MRKELKEVHFLRAFASLAVCFFHLFCGNVRLFPDTAYLKTIFSYGYLGVEIFFMLSGFIICYSLPVSYSYQDFSSFIIKRLRRIEPPYIISIVLVLGLNAISHKITGLSNHIDWLSTGFHLAYLNNFGLGHYANVVYWTLGIEFQFYLIIGLLFPLIKRRLILSFMLIGMACLSCIGQIKSMDLITPYLSIFGLGILIYFYRIKKFISTIWFMFLGALLLLHVFWFLGQPFFWACVFCMSVLFYWQYDNKIISFFSKISFSLYLTHTLIGGKVVNLGLRFIHNYTERYILFIIALFASVSFAYIFYWFIEKPSITWSKKVHYKIVKTIENSNHGRSGVAGSPAVIWRNRTGY